MVVYGPTRASIASKTSAGRQGTSERSRKLHGVAARARSSAKGALVSKLVKGRRVSPESSRQMYYEASGPLMTSSSPGALSWADADDVPGAFGRPRHIDQGGELGEHPGRRVGHPFSDRRRDSHETCKRAVVPGVTDGRTSSCRPRCRERECRMTHLQMGGTSHDRSWNARPHPLDGRSASPAQSAP